MAVAESVAPRFGIERAVKRTFSVIGSNLLSFGVLSLVTAAIPFLLVVWSSADYNQTPVDQRQLTLATGAFIAASWFVYLFGMFLLQATVVYASIASLNGRSISLSECIAAGVSSIVPLLGLSVLLMLGLFGGILLLLVPGLMLIAMWFVAVPALIVERTGVFGALGRSRELTSGYRWPIFGLYIAYFVLAMILSLGVGALTGSNPGDPAAAAASGLAPVHLIISVIMIMVTQTINATLVSSVYYELRQIKDGVGPESLASVFD